MVVANKLLCRENGERENDGNFTIGNKKPDLGKTKHGCMWRRPGSVEKILEFSGAKWYTPGLEPVILHDILSDSIPDIRDDDSMEITAMMHEVKEDVDLLNSTSDLNLEDDDPDLSNMPVDLQDYLEEWKGYSTFPGRDLQAYETTADPMDPIMQEEPKETEEETRSHSGPPGEE